MHPQLPTKPTNQGGREVPPCPLWPCSLPSKKMQVQLPLLNGQKALDHEGIKHQQPQTHSVLGDSTVKVCHGGSASREHMRDGRTEEELKQRLVDRWMTHTQMSPLPSSLCVSNIFGLYSSRAHLLQRGLKLYPEIWRCRGRARQGAEVQQGLGVIKVRWNYFIPSCYLSDGPTKWKAKLPCSERNTIRSN